MHVYFFATCSTQSVGFTHVGRVSCWLVFTAVCTVHHSAITPFTHSPADGHLGCFQVSALTLSGSVNFHGHVSLKSLTLAKTFHVLLFSWAGMPCVFISAHFLLILQASAYMQSLQRNAHSPELGYQVLPAWAPTAISAHLFHNHITPYFNCMSTSLFISLDFSFFEADACPGSMLRKSVWEE